MAKWYLLNSIKFRAPGANGAGWLLAGELLDDTQINMALISGAGGQYVPSTNAAAAAAVGTALAPGPVLKARRYVGEEWWRLDSLMMAAVFGAVANEGSNLQSSSALAGATVAAGAAISAAVTITPKSSGNVRVKAWASFAALASGTVTPILKQGATTIAAPAQYTGAAGSGPYEPNVEVEVTGLVPGTAYTFSWVTTAGDATATLGHGSTGSGAFLSAVEHP